MAIKQDSAFRAELENDAGRGGSFFARIGRCGRCALAGDRWGAADAGRAPTGNWRDHSGRWFDCCAGR